MIRNAWGNRTSRMATDGVLPRARLGRLGLPGVDRVECRAEDLHHVGGLVGGEGEDGGLYDSGENESSDVQVGEAVDVSGRETGYASVMPAVGSGSRPAARRTRSRSRSWNSAVRPLSRERRN